MEIVLISQKKGDYKVLTVPSKSINLENVACKTVRGK